MADAVVVGDQVLGFAATGPVHGCNDKCHADEGERLYRLRVRADLPVWPLDPGWVLPRLKHRCGPWCAPEDDGGPVLLGRRGETVTAGRQR